MDINRQLTSIWKELHRYSRIVSDINYGNYRLLTYCYDLELFEVRLEHGAITRIEKIL